MWGLKINNEKTKHMNIGKRNLNCKIKDTVLENVTQIKFLGITIDNRGHYEEHIKNLESRCIPLISFLIKLRNDFKTNQKTLTILYKSLIRSILEYGHVLLLNLTKSRKQKIEKIQNRALRAILACDYFTSNETIRNNLKIEKMLERHK